MGVYDRTFLALTMLNIIDSQTNNGVLFLLDY